MTVQIPLEMLDVFLSILLFSNAVFEQARYYFSKLEVRYSKISNQEHIRVRIMDRTRVVDYFF